MKLLILVLVLFMVQLGKTEYNKEGNHWFPNDDQDTDINTGIFEFEDLFDKQDAENLANKYTEDCVYVHQDLGVLRGREEVRGGYEQLFLSGIAGLHMGIISEGKLGPGYRYAMVAGYYFDKNGQNIMNSDIWAVLKQVEGGYETFLKTEMIKAEPKTTSK